MKTEMKNILNDEAINGKQFNIFCFKIQRGVSDQYNGKD
jgi:hypothetical protein